MSEEQLRALMASNAAALEAQRQEAEKEMRELRESQDRTEIQLEKTIKGIADLRKQTGHFINNGSLSDEEYFYRTMEAHPQLGNMAFHDVQRNMQLRNYDPEFDLVMLNDNVRFL